MNNDISRLVVSVLTDLFGECRRYSGRAMYGAECVGIDCDGDTSQTLVKLVIGLCELGEDGVEAADHLSRDGAVKTDSMGRGTILYFPRLPWLDEEAADACPTSEDADTVEAVAALRA